MIAVVVEVEVGVILVSTLEAGWEGIIEARAPVEGRLLLLDGDRLELEVVNVDAKE